jgi:hypothetical protein
MRQTTETEQPKSVKTSNYIKWPLVCLACMALSAYLDATLWAWVFFIILMWESLLGYGLYKLDLLEWTIANAEHGGNQKNSDKTIS